MIVNLYFHGVLVVLVLLFRNLKFRILLTHKYVVEIYLTICCLNFQ